MRIKLKRKEAIAGLEGIASLPAVLVVKVSTPWWLAPGVESEHFALVSFPWAYLLRE